MNFLIAMKFLNYYYTPQSILNYLERIKNETNTN